MPKIYALCLDAFPETVDLSNYLVRCGFKRSTLVCSGAFTCSTMTSLISGQIGSEIIPGGIGYYTTYHERFLTWRKSGNCLVDRLSSNDKAVIIHNHIPWMSHNIVGTRLSEKEKTENYRDWDKSVNNSNISILSNQEDKFGVMKKVKENLSYTSTHPDLTLNTFLEWNNVQRKKNFYSNEKKYIKFMQSQSFNGLFWNDLCHWHESVYYPKGQIEIDGTAISREDAISDSVNWLSYWNFDEPDSIFFIYADHSHDVTPYLDPPAYLTYVYFKDNYKNNQLNPLISSCDFYSLVEDAFKLEKLNLSKFGENPFSPYDPNRIYACEDNRADAIIKESATTFLRGTLFQNHWMSIAKVTDNSLVPSGIYLIITLLNNKYTYTLYRFDELESNYVESFSIVCNGPLSERKRVSDLIYPVTSGHLDKAKELYNNLA